MTSQPYLMVPNVVIDRYHDDPLAVAVYAGIVRCCIAEGGPVPLSAPDLAEWFGLIGEPGRAAVMRRIQRLTRDGWVTSIKSAGTKPILQPTWGRSREGELRGWDWGRRGWDQPNWLRGRRVPLALFDHYVGRLIPHPTKPADHQCWWALPLLDGVDVGTWVIGLRRDVTWTMRIQQLKIDAGVLPTLDELRARADAGTLVSADAFREEDSPTRNAQVGEKSRRARSRARPKTRSACGSGQPIDPDPDRAARTAAGSDTAEADRSQASITWDHELINMHESPRESDPRQMGREGGDRAGARDATNANPSDAHHTPAANATPHTDRDPQHQLSPQVLSGHQVLNPGIAIPLGEWLELARLEQQHGSAMLLIWQARAQRRSQAISGRVVPAYYNACAQREAVDSYHPQHAEQPIKRPHPRAAAAAPSEQADPAANPLALLQRTRAAPAKPILAAEADRLLDGMGIRAKAVLADVPLALIERWQLLIDHPALAARFPRDHRGWIWTQLRDQQEPPSAEELACWARACSASQPTDWRAVAAELGDLARLGDDLTGLASPDIQKRDDEASQAAIQEITTQPSPAHPTDGFAARFRADIRLWTTDRGMRQAVERARIEEHGGDLVLRCATTDLRLLLNHTALLRAAAAAAGYPGAVRCMAC